MTGPYQFENLHQISQYFGGVDLFECKACGQGGVVEYPYNKLEICTDCARKIHKAVEDAHGGKR